MIAKFLCRMRAVLLALLALIAVGMPASASPARPVLVVPGILGSVLSDSGGREVWGDVNSLGNFSRLEIGSDDPVEALKATGLAHRINVLGPFWAIHGYEALLNKLHDLGYVDGQTLFTFPYDWRRSNFDTAKNLDDFVRSHRELSAGKFDVIAHSMGGLVVKIWALNYGGANRIRVVAFMGTPFRGSMNALATVSEGWDKFNWLAGGIDTIRRVSLSFPSLYELLPTYEKCCRLNPRPAPGAAAPNFAFLDILNPDTWRRRDWLPPDYRAGGPRAAAFDEGMSRAREIGALMQKPIPGVKEIRFAADVVSTRLYLYVDPQKPGWRDWDFSASQGDGTVPIWSANNDMTTPSGSEISFSEHATIFEDENLLAKLTRELLGGPPPPVKGPLPDALVINGRAQELDLLDAAVDPPLVEPGGSAKVTLRLDFADPVVSGLLQPELSFEESPQTRIAMRDVTTGDEAARRRLSFAADLAAPAEAGTHRLNVLLPGKPPFAVYLTIAAGKGGKAP